MKGYALIDKNNGNVDCAFSWSDGSEIPSDYPIGANQEAKEIDFDSSTPYYNLCYDLATGQMQNKLVVNVDKKKISNLGEVSNITVTYPEQANENCSVTIDDQSIEIPIVNGTSSFQFSSEILGFHILRFASTSKYGKQSLSIEVIE